MIVQFSIRYLTLACLTFSVLSVSSISSIAQISGLITDNKSGKPLGGVEVFVNKTILHTQSDELGQFRLEEVPTGFHEIVLYRKGYALYQSSMKVQPDRAYNLNLSLIASKKKKGTRLTEEEKVMLKDKFSPASNASLLATLNTNDFEATEEDGKRILTAKAPLIIENEITGYRIFFYMMGLPLPDLSLAPVKYELLPSAGIQQNIDWEKNRKKYFLGSPRHWLMAMSADKLVEEGYSIQDEKRNNIEAKSLISVSSLAGYSTLTIAQPLTVIYKNDGTMETSKVIADIPVDVNREGLLINSKALVVTGDMAKKLGDELPFDFQPIAGDVEIVYSQTIEQFYEKVYVHTDKPYYYPGEPIWFKGYINYKEPAWRDSLSKVMYVELINPDKKITLTKILKIDSGFFSNDFILSDSLKAGNYYLRAYTNLNRNFGDSALFLKQIPILSITDKVDREQENMAESVSSFLTISHNKEKYNTREKITLTIQVKDKQGKPLASNLSMTITDVVQVVPITEQETILNGFPFEKNNTSKVIDLKYPVEYGVGFTGRFKNDNDKPEKATLTILQMKPRTMMMATTDEKGIFSLTGLDFYDTATFSFKADKARDNPYGKVELMPREVPPMDFEESKHSISVQNTQSQQRIISEYEVPKGVRLLEGVEVKARRIEEQYEKDYRVKRPYGKPDYVLKEKDINTGYGNLLFSIQGKFPGLIVRETEIGWVVYTQRGAGSSYANKKEVTVMINDVPVGGSPAQIISSINPQTVEAIEFTNRINVLYGSSSGFGVLSIYTKQGATEEDIRVAPNFQTINTQGYFSARNYKFPDYESKETDVTKADYRSTIYWNPEVVTDAKTGTASISFFASDLQGKYRIVAEGITQHGEPIRGVYFLEVDNN